MDRPIEKKKKKRFSKKKEKKKRGRQIDRQRRRRKKGKKKKKKKKKQLLPGATPASSYSSFSPSSLFSFLTNETFRVLAWYPFTDRNSRISPVKPVFFLV